MPEFDLKQYLSTRKQVIDEALERFAPAPTGLEGSVAEASRYSLFAGGKRLRPILCLAAADVFDGAQEMVLRAACALEMIHTYSLIHDDLPAMDNDDFRRGRPTNHKVFGEAMAILAGDALLTEAFSLMTDAGARGTAPAERLIRVIAVIARAAGYRGMVGGQVIDLESESREVDLATVEYMHLRKTGALISAALEAGAILGSASEDQIAALTRYGHHLGLAFQITDDLLDIEGDPEVMGKASGSDVAKNKKTYPALLGLAQTRKAATMQVEQALAALVAFDGRAEPLRAIARYLLIRKS